MCFLVSFGGHENQAGAVSSHSVRARSSRSIVSAAEAVVLNELEIQRVAEVRAAAGVERADQTRVDRIGLARIRVAA